MMARKKSEFPRIAKYEEVQKGDTLKLSYVEKGMLVTRIGEAHEELGGHAWVTNEGGGIAFPENPRSASWSDVKLHIMERPGS